MAKCLTGFRGTPQDKMAAYTYLGSLATNGNPGLQVLVSVVQSALSMQDPAHADDSSLSGVYGDMWQQILIELAGGNDQ